MRASHVALALLGLLAAGVAAPAWSESLGRWSERPAQCRRSWVDAQPGPCASVVLDQRTAGVMRVLLLAPAAAPVAYNQLAFVGQLPPGSEPMACRNGTCTLNQPIALALSSVSQGEFDGRGLARGLPHAWPVEGQCQLRPERITCEARALSGERWQAEARSGR
jgi:hypothetical protein